MKNKASKLQKKRRKKKPDLIDGLSKRMLHQLTMQFAKHADEFFAKQETRIVDEMRSFYVPSTVVIGAVRVSTIKLADAERIAMRLHNRFFAPKKPQTGREIG